MMADCKPPLSIESLVIRTNRIVCDVVVSPGVSHTTSRAIIERVCAAFPNLPRHACVNDKGDTFSAVMNCTPLPHLLEHLVVDEQVRAAARTAAVMGEKGYAADMIFTGTTEWIDERAGRARIEVNFTDDLVALRAFRDAVNFLNAVVVL